MKQKRTTIIALVCGAICAISVALFMGSLQSEIDQERVQSLARYGGEQVEVCVATRDIAAGEQIDLSAIETKLWVSGLLPDEAVLASQDVLGKTAATSICKGEVIVAKRFEKRASSLDIPAGLQAVSVPVKAVQAVGGNIQAGMRVNIYATGDATTTRLMSDVLVLDTSVGESEGLSSSSSGWITLAVTPARVQDLVAASNKTSLYFVLPSEEAGEDSDNERGEDLDAAASPQTSTTTEATSAMPSSTLNNTETSTNAKSANSAARSRVSESSS